MKIRDACLVADVRDDPGDWNREEAAAELIFDLEDLVFWVIEDYEELGFKDGDLAARD